MIRSISDFQVKFLDEVIKNAMSPQWKPVKSAFNEWAVKELAFKSGRKPFEAQMELVIVPQAYSLMEKGRKGAILIAEMGTGKTQMSNDILFLFHRKRAEKNGAGTKACFLASGGKHIRKMAREAFEILGDQIDDIVVVKSSPKKRRIKIEVAGNELSYREATLDDVLEAKPEKGKILYVILSKDAYKFEPKKKDFSGKKCPRCGYELPSLTGRKRKVARERCGKCGEILFSFAAPRAKKMSAAEKIRRAARFKTDKLFDFTIVDEVHEMQNMESLQSRLYHQLIRTSAKTVVMTGTMVNGYASSLFYILYPIIPRYFKEYGGFSIEKIGAFIDLFGAKESSIVLDGRGGRLTKELPKISDRIVGFLSPFSTWMSVDDLGKKMPPLTEIVRIAPFPTKLAECFDRWQKDISLVLELAQKKLDRKEMARLSFKEKWYMAQAVHYLSNNPTLPYEREVAAAPLGLKEKKMSFGSAHFPSLSEEELFPKEELLVSDIKKEKREGRRILLYGNYIKVNRLFDRLSHVIRREIPEVIVDIVPENLPPEKIEEYITSSSADVVMVSQERVATGLDLVMFQTVMFYELNRKVRTVEQAKMRPWRPVGQDREVRVYYYGYSGSQSTEITTIAQKMRASAAVNGRIAQDGTLAKIFDYDPEITESMEKIKESLDMGKGERLEALKKENSELALMYREYLAEAEKNRQETSPKEEITVLQKPAKPKKEPKMEKPKEKPQIEEYKKDVKQIIQKDQTGQTFLAF